MENRNVEVAAYLTLVFIATFRTFEGANLHRLVQ